MLIDMKTTPRDSLSRREFLQDTGIGLSLMLSAMPAFALSGSADTEAESAGTAEGNSSVIKVHPANPHYYLFRGRPTILITSAEHYGG